MARDKLGEVRQRLYKRYRQTEKKVLNASIQDLVADKVERLIFSFLVEYGLDFPIDFIHPPPDAEVVARQGTKCLDPDGTVSGGTPSVALDEACLTWKARKGGFLVVDHLDFIMEDPVAEADFTIEWKFDEQVNDPKRQSDNATAEMGHWKFNRMVLIDGEVLTTCVRNDNDFAGGCFSVESEMWTL